MYSCMKHAHLLQNSRGQQWEFIMQWTECHFILIKEVNFPQLFYKSNSNCSNLNSKAFYKGYTDYDDDTTRQDDTRHDDT